MKKTILFIIGVGCNMFIACHGDNTETNELDARTNQDTASPLNRSTAPDSTGKVGFPKL